MAPRLYAGRRVGRGWLGTSIRLGGPARPRIYAGHRAGPWWLGMSVPLGASRRIARGAVRARPRQRRVSWLGLCVLCVYWMLVLCVLALVVAAVAAWLLAAVAVTGWRWASAGLAAHRARRAPAGPGVVADSDPRPGSSWDSRP